MAKSSRLLLAKTSRLRARHLASQVIIHKSDVTGQNAWMSLLGFCVESNLFYQRLNSYYYDIIDHFFSLVLLRRPLEPGNRKKSDVCGEGAGTPDITNSNKNVW